MNGDDRAILLGMVFGDGHISPNIRGFSSASLRVKHCAKQADYAEHKANLVTSVLGGKRPSIRCINNNGYPGVVFDKTNTYFRILRNWLYVDGKKKLSPYIKWLTPHGLALWYMDDGGLGKKLRNGKVHAVDLYINCYTDRLEAEIICDELWKLTAVRFVPNQGKGQYRIRCGTREARKFGRIIAPFMIDSMMYKLAIPEEPTSARQLVIS